MLRQATQNLVTTALDAASTDADLQASAQAFFTAVGCATISEVNEAVSRLAEFFSLDDPQRSAFLALVCGALVERGCDPTTIVQPLCRRLQSFLEAAAVLANVCRNRIPTFADDDDEDPSEAFERIRRQTVSEMPNENAAWEALTQFWRPAIAVFSVSAAARAAARDLRSLAAEIADQHEGGHWLRLMLSVLDDELILVIEPQTSRGILGQISGVVDNFQLNVLLMDAFPNSGFLAHRRVSKQVVDVARGVGPQQTDESVTAVWNLYTWEAIEPGLKLPDPTDHAASAHWIWNEGSPEDIPAFEGRRTILLGPASYQRFWDAQRMFDRLPATLECQGELAKREVTDWLQRMAVAKSAR